MRHLQPFKAHRGLQRALPARCSMREKLSSSKRRAHPHTHGRIGAASSQICRHSYSTPTEGHRSARWYHLVSKRRPPHCHWQQRMASLNNVKHIDGFIDNSGDLWETEGGPYPSCTCMPMWSSYRPSSTRTSRRTTAAARCHDSPPPSVKALKKQARGLKAAQAIPGQEPSAMAARAQQIDGLVRMRT